MIELDGATKLAGGKRIVDGISLKVEPGAICALVGPSGSGKSTTLRLINRLIALDGGTIRIGGADIQSLPVTALRRRIGYAIQSVGLFPHWTIADNIATVPRLLGWDEKRVAKRVEELLALVRLDPAAARKYPHQLSGGQQQRVGVARALAGDPELLLMDEPFGALDPITRQALRAELKDIHRATRTTILIVTHDIDEALELGDRIAILKDGKLVQFGTPADILAHPADAFVREFMGGDAIGLKLLAMRRVGDVARPGEVSGDPIAREAPLSEALSQMVLRRTDRLPVSEGGSVSLTDLVV